MQRYFATNKELELTKNDIHHIINVMRMKINDRIIIVFDEKAYLCEITKITKEKVDFDIIKELNENNKIEKEIVVAFSLISENKTDFIFQKCTELGVSKFIPLLTEHSKIKINGKEDKKIERWNKICKEASEQSHRNKLPEITNIKRINDLKNIDYDLKILCSTKEKEKSLKNCLQKTTKYDTIIIVVGPEGGFSENEEKILTENGFISVSLGSLILRAETAPIFATSAIKYELMR